MDNQTNMPPTNPSPTPPPPPPPPAAPQAPQPNQSSLPVVLGSLVLALLLLGGAAFYYYTFIQSGAGGTLEPGPGLNEGAPQSDNSVDTLEAELEATEETNLDSEVTNLNQSL